ncbi:MAG TPA: hypothetical protein VMS88_06020 [Terriglobales bacterium]|nr:hypothetical protein [Terriglobales bacterium]
MGGDLDFPVPSLRFVPSEALVLHERFDPQRTRPLVECFRREGVLRNPPVVAELTPGTGDELRYVVLDGANRASAGREAGLPHMAVQLVRYEEPDVRLTTWTHALADFPRAELESVCAAVAHIECRAGNLMRARAQVARREALAYVAYAGGAVSTFHGGATLHEKNALLNALVDAYRDRHRYYRLTTQSIETARARHREVTALVVFPQLEPAEVVELAADGDPLPAGITRHLIRWRALRVDVPLERLADRSEPIEKKNLWLWSWIEQKQKQRQVRFYEESTVLFDE